MAYINKFNFEIIDSTNDENEEKNYFECDDMIAPIIQVLNRKGYYTTNCCEGHSYFSNTQLFCQYDKTKTMEDYKSNVLGAYYVEILKSKNDGFPVLIKTKVRDFDAYISFCPSIKIPTFPEGWNLEEHDEYFDEASESFIEGYNCIIRYNYTENENLKVLAEELSKSGENIYTTDKLAPFYFFKEKINVMEKLYKWACELPE